MLVSIAPANVEMVKYLHSRGPSAHDESHCVEPMNWVVSSTCTYPDFENRTVVVLKVLGRAVPTFLLAQMAGFEVPDHCHMQLMLWTTATNSFILLQLQGVLHKRPCSAEVQLRCMWELLTNATILTASPIHICSLQAMVETRFFPCEVLETRNHEIMIEILVNVNLLSRVQDAQLLLTLVSNNEQGDTFCKLFHSLVSMLSEELQISWDPGGQKSFGFFTQPGAKMRNAAASTYYCGHFVSHDYVINTIDLDYYLGAAAPTALASSLSKSVRSITSTSSRSASTTAPTATSATS
jgi:hypothetical protein